MPEILLTKGAVALIDDDDYERISAVRWSLHSYSGYAWRTYPEVIWMHRLIVRPPADLQVDHINGNRLDNRRCNLRICTSQQNAFNRKCRRDSRSQLKGITPHGNGKWRAFLRAGGRKTYLGTFASPNDAARAYDKAAIEMYGEFARLNFPATKSVTQPSL